VPAEMGTQLAVFDKVFCDIGDEQSIEANLSTFSAHMKSIVLSTNQATKNSLVLLDEPGAGTDPKEGSALAEAICVHLLKSGSKSIVTTHFSELKQLKYSNSGVENASMGFDSETLLPTFKLNIGLAGASNALVIAKRLGLDLDILEYASKLISREAMTLNTALTQAHESLRVAELERVEAGELLSSAKKTALELQAELEKVRREKEKLQKSAKREVDKLVDAYLEEADELIAKMKEAELFEAYALRKKLTNIEYKEIEIAQKTPQKKVFVGGEIGVGDKVYVESLASDGVVLSVNPKKKEVRVRAGSLTVDVDLADCKKCQK